MSRRVHESWSSGFGFLMAAIGFAVGLGNIWRFPYVTGEHGGGIFVVVYLLCAFGIGVPILMAELMIGRRGALNPLGSMRKVAVEEGRSPWWTIVGGLNLVTVFLIMSIYSVIAGWVLFYLFQAATTAFSGMDTPGATNLFARMLGDVGVLTFWTALALCLAGGIVYFGVQSGIERAVRVLMPTLFVLLLVLLVYNVSAEGFGAAAGYLFAADFNAVTPGMVLAAIGQAFFSIGVAMAGMMTFGAYLPRSVSITRSAIAIVAVDTLVALVAGLVVFPVVFRFGLDPAGGPGLVFQTLPVAFAQMPGGHLISSMFFLLLAVGALTSMVGGVEPLIAWLEEHRSLARHQSTLIVVASVGAVGMVSVLSFNVWENVQVGGLPLSDALDHVANQTLLPLGGFLIALFAGWFVSGASARAELDMRTDIGFRLWRGLIRYLVPPAVFAILITGTFA